MDKQLFCDFFHRNLPADMEECISLFALFGGIDEAIDTDQSVETLLERHVLAPFETHRAKLMEPLGEEGLYIRLLRAIAVGDRRHLSAYRRAKIGKERGSEAFEYLRRNGYLTLERSRETPPVRLHPKQKFKKEVERHKISHKLRFATPFLRFWFAFVEPFSETIRRGEYDPFWEHFRLHANAFTGFTFEELCGLYIREILAERFDVQLLDSGSYWDREVEIDLFCETYEGETWIGECKWTNHKVNKKELRHLEEKCLRLSLEPDKIFLFAKRGFSNELAHLRSARLYLFDAEELMALTRRP